MESFFYLFVAGILGGFISGLVGIGGGVVYVFVIPLALKYIGVPPVEIPQYTIANSILAIFFSSLISNFLHIRAHNFYLKEVLIIGLLGIVFSLALLRFFVNTPYYSIYTFNIILIVLMIYMLISTLISAKKVYLTPLETLKRWKLAGVGAAGGAISALSGLGGGVVIIPLLNSMMRVDIKKASSISLGVITIISFFMTLFNLLAEPRVIFRYDYAIGYIVGPVCIALVLGGFIGSPLGVKVSERIPSSNISYIYAIFLSIVITKKVYELIQLI